MHKKIEMFVKIIIAATFFVPLIVIPASYIFPFIVPKIVWFRGLTMVLLGAYLVLLASNWQKYRPKSTLTNWAVLFFLLSFAVSTFVGVDWYKSFWDNHERMLGLFTIFHFVLYYFVASNVVRDWSEWKWLLRIFLFAGGIVMFIGVWQRFVDPQALLNSGGNRVSATLGNPIYYSGYGLFLFFIGYLLAVKERLFSAWQIYAALGGLLGFLGIFLGATRGTLLGLIAGIFIMVFSYLFALKDHKNVKKIAILGICLMLILFGVLYNYRQTKFVSSLPAVGGLLNLSLKGGTVGTRLLAWQIAIKGWEEKPIFGWGPNNYYYAFNKYYLPEFLEHGYSETWFDNAHSAIMNTLTVQGGIGLLSYLGLFIVPIFALWRGYKRGVVKIHIACVGTAFLVGHFVHNSTVFENPTSYLYFFLFLAFVSSQTTLVINNEQLTTNKNEINKNTINKNPSIGLCSVVFLLVAILIYSTDINPARANKATLNTIRALYGGQKADDLLAKAMSIPSPHIDDIRNDYARAANMAMAEMMTRNLSEKAMDFFQPAYDELKKNRILHPMDIRVNLQQAQMAQLVAQIKKDYSMLAEAESALEAALKESPKRQQVQFMLSSIKLQLNKPTEAIKLSEEALNNDPKVGESWWRLAMAYGYSGNKQKAIETIDEGKSKGIVFSDPQAVNFINSLQQ